MHSESSLISVFNFLCTYTERFSKKRRKFQTCFNGTNIVKCSYKYRSKNAKFLIYEVFFVLFIRLLYKNIRTFELD